MASRLVLALLILFLLAASVTGHGGGADDSDADPDSAGAGDKPDLRSKGLIVVKIWCLVLVFAGTFAGGISPYFLKWNEGFLILGTQFAGGVFFGTALMHFLSDSNETFEDLTSKEYPFAFMLACAGYLLTMSADVVIGGIVSRSVDSGDLEGGSDGGSSRPGKTSTNGGCSQSCSQTTGATGAALHPSLVNASSLGDSILLIVALCLHSVFEGIAIGVAETKADAWRSLWTVSLHKVFAAIAMSITLLRMTPNRPFVSCASYTFAFAISSPVGVAIGIVIDATTQGRVADWIYAISMGIACGVFVYVSINHLLSKGYRPQHPIAVDTPLCRWLLVVLGVGVIAVVMIWD